MKSKIIAIALSIMSVSASAEIAVTNPKIYNKLVYGWVQVDGENRWLGVNCEDKVLLEVEKGETLFYTPRMKFLTKPVKNEKAVVEALCREWVRIAAARGDQTRVIVAPTPVYHFK